MISRYLSCKKDMAESLYSGSTSISSYGENVSREIQQLGLGHSVVGERNLDRTLSAFLGLPQLYGERGWNGYAAEPLSRESYEYASRFLQKISPNVPTPKILVDANGDVSFHWYKSLNDRLEITFSKRQICFALVVRHGERTVISIASQPALMQQMNCAIAWSSNAGSV